MVLLKSIKRLKASTIVNDYEIEIHISKCWLVKNYQLFCIKAEENHLIVELSYQQK